MSEPLTPERLAEIRERWSGGVMGWRTVYELVDEVERLRTQRDNAVATVAEQAKKLTAREREHNADRAERDKLAESAALLGRVIEAAEAVMRQALTTWQNGDAEAAMHLIAEHVAEA